MAVPRIRREVRLAEDRKAHRAYPLPAAAPPMAVAVAARAAEQTTGAMSSAAASSKAVHPKAADRTAFPQRFFDAGDAP